MLQDGPQLGHVKIMMLLRASTLQPRTRPQSVDLYRIPILGTYRAHLIILANEARFARDAWRVWTILSPGSNIDLTHQSYTLDLTPDTLFPKTQMTSRFYNSIKLLTKNTTNPLFRFYAITMQRRPQHPIIILFQYKIGIT